MAKVWPNNRIFCPGSFAIIRRILRRHSAADPANLRLFAEICAGISSKSGGEKLKVRAISHMDLAGLVFDIVWHHGGAVGLDRAAMVLVSNHYAKKPEKRLRSHTEGRDTWTEYEGLLHGTERIFRAKYCEKNTWYHGKLMYTIGAHRSPTESHLVIPYVFDFQGRTKAYRLAKTTCNFDEITDPDTLRYEYIYYVGLERENGLMTYFYKPMLSDIRYTTRDVSVQANVRLVPGCINVNIGLFDEIPISDIRDVQCWLSEVELIHIPNYRARFPNANFLPMMW